MRKFLAVALCVVSLPLAAQDCPVRLVQCADPDDRSCPAECRRDLSALGISVVHTAGQEMSSLGGMWIGPPLLSPSMQRTIVINSAQRLCMQKQARHHERCHEALYLKTGSSWFHH